MALNFNLTFIEKRKYVVAEKLWVYWGVFGRSQTRRWLRTPV